MGKYSCCGILPMAGQARRLQPFRGSKELLDISFEGQPLAISEYSIRSQFLGGAQQVILVVHPDKKDIVEHYRRLNPRVSFCQYAAPSLPESCLYPTDHLQAADHYLFGLPDTLFSPADAYRQVYNRLKEGVDLCLGLFRVPDASLFDSVLVRSNQVQAVAVKQSPALSDWIWGIWGANRKALALLNEAVKRQKTKKEKLLGEAFGRLTDSTLKFEAVFLGDKYVDIGTKEVMRDRQKLAQVFSHELKALGFGMKGVAF